MTFLFLMLIDSPSIVRAVEPATAPVAQEHICIATARSELTLYVGADNRLYQLGYDKRDALLSEPKKLNRLDEFHPAAGNGFTEEPAIQAFHSDGNTSTDLLYIRHTTERVDDNVSITRIELKDPAYPFFVTLCFRTFADEDMIEQWAEIRHNENAPVTLFRFASSAPLLKAKDYWLTQFQGDYRREATVVDERLTSGMKVLDSKIGVRATRFRIPSFMISLNRQADEEDGTVYGASLEWSGSFQLAFELDPTNRLRALCGINPFGSQYRLEPGKVFTTPAMLWTFSEHGKGQISRNFHRWARRYGIRNGDKPRPVLLNNWESTYFNFDEQKIVSLFDGAKELGAELFLLDDGWFGNKHPRDNDTAGLGDWQVNARKLPRGLSYLADEAKKRGINPLSELFEKHPEWAMQQPHREPELSRNQLNLDLSNPDVREFAWHAIDNMLSANPGIAYMKWDANRYVTQPGSTYLPPEAQSNLLIDYNNALYDITARLAKNHPNVMAMACAGGSGRADYGAMRYFHCFWPSDNTDPRSRVLIQWGFSHFFPANTLCNHVTRMGNRPVKFALDVAMSGALGVDMDVSKCSPQERRAIASAVKLYKDELRAIVQQGDLYRLESPYDHPRSAISYVLADQSRAVLFVYQTASSDPKCVKLAGLDPQKKYRVREVNLVGDASSNLPENDKTLDGATLMRDGVTPTCSKELESAVIIFSASL
jgi:alpha-galactosidase